MDDEGGEILDNIAIKASKFWVYHRVPKNFHFYSVFQPSSASAASTCSPGQVEGSSQSGQARFCLSISTMSPMWFWVNIKFPYNPIYIYYTV